MRTTSAPPPGWNSPNVGSAVVLSTLVGLAVAAGLLFAAGVLASAVSPWARAIDANDVTTVGWKWIYWVWQLTTHPDTLRAKAETAHWIVWWQTSLAVAVIAGGGIGSWLGWALCRPPREIQFRGRRYLDGEEAVRLAKREMKRAYRFAGGPGVHIHPDVALPLHKEGLGLLITGSPGGGKTTANLQLLGEIIARGDRSIILDVKGEMTEYLYAPVQGRYLMSPGDTRTLAWDVAADVRNKPEAARWAARLVDESKDPLWSNSARMIATGLVVAEQVTKRGNWSLIDLMSATELPYPELRARVLCYYPEASQLLTEEPNRTTASILLNLAAYLPFLYMLGDAFSEAGHGGPVTRFSMRRWLTQPESWEAKNVRMLIVQFDGRVDELSYAIIQMMVSTLAGLVASPELPESRDRRLWLVLDEFSQLKKRIDDFLRIPELGRSKGLRWALSVQDLSQLREVYGNNITSTLTSMARYSITCRTQGVETPDWLSQLVGNRWLHRPTVTVSQHAGQTLSWHTVCEPVITNNEFANLGQHGRGVDALLLTGGDHVYRLTWPIRKWPKSSPANIPAPWTDPGFDGYLNRAKDRAADLARVEDPFAGVMPLPESQDHPSRPEEALTPMEVTQESSVVATEAPAVPAPRLKLRATDKITELVRKIRDESDDEGNEP